MAENQHKRSFGRKCSRLNGETLEAEVVERDGVRVWTKLAIRKLLKIRHRDTLNEHFSMLGYQALNVLPESQFKEVYAMHRFLRAGFGAYHSRSNYLRLKAVGLSAQKFLELGIDIDKEFEELINASNTEEIVSGNRSWVSSPNPGSQGVCRS